MNSGEDNLTEENSKNDDADMMGEAHNELNQSKKSVEDLITYRRSAFKSDQVKMDQYLDKAIDAINNLFNDEIPPDKEPD
jgi:hypothetical protein